MFPEEGAYRAYVTDEKTNIDQKDIQKSLFTDDRAEELRPMIVRRRGLHRCPAHIMRSGKLVAAFVEIRLELSSLPRLEAVAEKC